MKAIPEGFTTVTPSLVLKDAAKAIDLYKEAFGAKEISRMEMPGTGKIMHACLEFGNARLFFADAMPEMGCSTPSTSSFYLYFEDVEAAFKKAKAAGMTEKFPLTDMFWGDRTGNVTDVFGISWTMGQHVRDVSPEEMEKAGKEWTDKMKAGKAA